MACWEAQGSSMVLCGLHFENQGGCDERETCHPEVDVLRRACDDVDSLLHRPERREGGCVRLMNRPPWLQPLRRGDRALGHNDVERILRAGRICRVALCHQSWPYIVPMNYGWTGEKIYLHSARDGTKLRLMDANPNVCFEVTGAIDIVGGTSSCEATTRYESVVGWGRLQIVEDDAERYAGLRVLLAQHNLEGVAPTDSPPSDVVVLRIDPGFLGGKSSREAGLRNTRNE